MQSLNFLQQWCAYNNMFNSLIQLFNKRFINKLIKSCCARAYVHTILNHFEMYGDEKYKKLCGWRKTINKNKI